MNKCDIFCASDAKAALFSQSYPFFEITIDSDQLASVKVVAKIAKRMYFLLLPVSYSCMHSSAYAPFILPE